MSKVTVYSFHYYMGEIIVSIAAIYTLSNKVYTDTFNFENQIDCNILHTT